MRNLVSHLTASSLVAALFFSGAAFATQGKILQCHSADQQVAARVSLGETTAPRVILYKLRPGLPSYWLECTPGTTPGAWLNCTDTSNRTFILNQDYTATYVGSHETRDFVCVPSGFSAD